MHTTDLTDRSSPVCLIGKVPRKGDFVVHNASPATRAFDLWLQQAVEELQLAQQDLPPRIARVIMAVPETGQVVLGVIAPSQDQLGRKYPVALLATTPQDSLAHVQLATLDPFYAALEALIREIPALNFDEIVERLDAMAAPSSCIGRPRPVGASAAEFLEETLGSNSLVDQSYAVSTFCNAARAHRDNASTTGISVPCPVRDVAHAQGWLDLALRFTRFGQGLASALWDDSDESPILLSWGRTPRQALRFWTTPTLPANNLWPLRTAVESAQQAAVAEVGSILQGRASGGSCDIDTLWSALLEHFR